MTALRRLDRLLLVGIFALAFLLASTPARNSGLWLHLALGRAIADGSYRFQGDPFIQEATSSWIAHSWLYDLGTYGLFTILGETVGGMVLVILKAVLVALLAGLLVRLGRGERGLAWPTVAAALALLATAGRMLLQPALLSVLLLAGTLALLERGRHLRRDRESGWLAAYGTIALLFALWANLDDWFLLGPLTVALYLIGEALAKFTGGRDKDDTVLPDLALTLGVGLLACLLTPFHLHGFTLPAELGLTATAKALKQDPVLRHLFVSPFEAASFHAGAAWSIPGLAYLALVGLSALSFLGSRDAWRSWRLPVWLGLFGLSAWSRRAVPFFAVAAGPVLALNVQDLAQRYRPDALRSEKERLARLGRAAAMVLLLLLLIAAWPGWLQGRPYEKRRWAVLANPSLQEAAEKLAQWRKEGRLTDKDRVFNFAPKVANYLAWFCPAEKGVVDGRLHVSASEAEAYVRVRQALVEGKEADNGWRNYFRTKRINHVILDDEDRRRTSTAFLRLSHDSSEWFLMSLTGNTPIFGWKDPQKDRWDAGPTGPKPGPARRRSHLSVPSPPISPFSAGREAYHPSANKLAPRHGLPREPAPPRWWSGFLRQRPAGHPDRDAAGLLLLDFDALQGALQPQRQRIWEVSRIAALVGEGGPTLLAPCRQCLELNGFTIGRFATPQQTLQPPTTAMKLAYQLQSNYFHSQDDAPSELLFLALRAAWRGVCADPDDALAYALLGDAYLRLARNTRERVWIESNRLPFLRRLRAVQAASAYHRALRIDPDFLAAHAALASLYEWFDLIDLRLHHVREELRIVRAKSAVSPEDQKQRSRIIAYLEDQVRSLETRREKALDSYELAAAKAKNTVERAGIAQDRGLAETALKVLLDSDVAAFGAPGVEMELGLLLITGRADVARKWLLPEHESLLGAETYHQYRLELAAIQGDYEQADAEFAEMLAAAERPFKYYSIEATIPQAMALAFAQMLLDGRTERASLPQRGAVYIHRQQLFNVMMEMMMKMVQIRRKNADIRTIWGLLALECGNVREAAEQFRTALRLCSPEAAQPSGWGTDFNSRGLAEYFLHRLREAH